MPLLRRRLFALLALAAAGVGAALSTLRALRRRPSPARGPSAGGAAAPPPGPPPGPEPGDAALAAVLVEASAFLVRRPIDRATWQEHFEWRAANVPGARAFYRSFLEAADAAAARERAPSFAAASAQARERLLARLLPSAGDDLARWTHERLRQEILLRFSRAEAWRAIGHASWPGTARGLTDHLAPGRPPER